MTLSMNYKTGCWKPINFIKPLNKFYMSAILLCVQLRQLAQKLNIHKYIVFIEDCHANQSVMQSFNYATKF